MRRIILVALVVFLVAICAQAFADAGPEVVVFPGKGKLGSVTFEHLAHHERGADCTLCHHAGLSEGKCSGCHGPSPAAPHIQDAFHLLCIGCHKHQGAPADCEGCHVN